MVRFLVKKIDFQDIARIDAGYIYLGMPLNKGFFENFSFSLFLFFRASVPKREVSTIIHW
jgi:hypothetical protein